MKIAPGIILLIFMSSCNSLIIECFYSTDVRQAVGLTYHCSSITFDWEISYEKRIEKVYGTHENGKSNEDVESFGYGDAKLSFIPTNLACFFPNLRAMFIYSPLLQISASDLKPFPNLVYFDVQRTLFTNLDGDLFKHTRKLKMIICTIGKLENVGENILDGLNDLYWVNFMTNPCINLWANTQTGIQNVKQQLLVGCPPQPECFARSSVKDKIVN
jgi:hypothetical protein